MVVWSLSQYLTLATPWTVACQTPVSMESSRQEYRSGLPFPSPGDLPNLGIEPRSPAFQANFLLSEPPGKSWHSRVSANPELKGWRYPLIIRDLTVFISMWDRYLWKRPEIFKWWYKAFPRFDFGKSNWNRGHETAYYYQNAPIFKLHARVASGNIRHPKQQVKLSQR